MQIWQIQNHLISQILDIYKIKTIQLQLIKFPFDVSLLRELPELEYIGLEYCNLENVTYLSGCRKLKVLNVTGSNVDTKKLKELLKYVEIIDFSVKLSQSDLVLDMTRSDVSIESTDGRRSV